jgi:hypothetical protein
MLESTTARDGVGCRLVSELLRSFGSVEIRVRGSSMLPCVLPGDVLAVQRKELDEVDRGDIVLFTRDNRLFAHRVVIRVRQGAIRDGAACLVTCGDAGGENDPPVFARQLLGRVSFIIRGDQRISPRATFIGRLVSLVFRRSHFLARIFIWTVNRSRMWREEAECRT